MPEEMAHEKWSPSTGQVQEGDSFCVLGGDLRATYLAHLLAGLPQTGPVRLLLSTPSYMRQWQTEGRSVRVIRGGTVLPQQQIRAELIETHGQPEQSILQGMRLKPHIDNLVVTMPCTKSIDALARLRHRIDDRTTICLLQGGLGVAERLMELVFGGVEGDPRLQPQFVLGHMTHDLGFHEVDNFTVSELTPGKLRLAALSDPLNERTQRLLHLLGLTPTLGAGGYAMGDFLRHKLPDMIFQAAVEPVATVLDLHLDDDGDRDGSHDDSHDLLWNNQQARAVVEALVAEMLAVVARLPETAASPALAHDLESGQLERQIWQRRSKRPRAAVCDMARQTMAGRVSDVQFLNGYFVRRGRALGVACPANEMAIVLVRAQQKAARAKLDRYIPFVGDLPAVLMGGGWPIPRTPAAHRRWRRRKKEEEEQEQEERQEDHHDHDERGKDDEERTGSGQKFS